MDMTDKELAVQVELAHARLAALKAQYRAQTAEMELTRIAGTESESTLRALMQEQERRAQPKPEPVKPEPAPVAVDTPVATEGTPSA